MVGNLHLKQVLLTFELFTKIKFHYLEYMILIICQLNNIMNRWSDWRIATIQIYYYLPDYLSILQEFVWQTEDLAPEFPRIHKFLWHWKNNIHAPIETINLSYADPFGKTKYINCNQIFKI